MLHMACPMLLGGGGAVALPGQQLFTSDGSFVVPAGVTSICAVAIGAGGNTEIDPFGDGFDYVGGGGGLGYNNAIAVTPGETLAVAIGYSAGPATTLKRGPTILAGANPGGPGANGGPSSGSIGFTGGAGTYVSTGVSVANGAGAGGYTSAGGNAGGGTGKGGGGSSVLGGTTGGATGAATNRDGLAYGGGGAVQAGGNGFQGFGAPGAVRIIWGAGRAFPNTNTGNV
ncbi:hypothetical protein [Brevundimonas sp. SL161]|uniref:hypothetical protein n=1 Tax=Brevundimonas sp. SL161 TaxID=2804613 RepID=UPI003CF8D041